MIKVRSPKRKLTVAFQKSRWRINVLIEAKNDRRCHAMHALAPTIASEGRYRNRFL